MQDPKNRHLGTFPQLCRAISSQLKHISTIGKKLVEQQCHLHMYLQYGELGVLVAQSVSLVWGTPANFNGFRVLAALLHGTPILGVSHTLRRWTEGATYIWQGGHHVGHWPTFLVSVFITCEWAMYTYIHTWGCSVHVVGHENLNQSTENNSLKIKIETGNCYVQTEAMYKMFVWNF